MPRRPRIEISGLLQHIARRGIDRQACFLEDSDRPHYLADLRAIAQELGCAIHANVLMGSHVHLRSTPRAPSDAGRMMQASGRRYVGVVNDRYGRRGSLWERRFRASLVTFERNLLACMRYTKLNPVRAGLVVGPGDYP